MLRTPPLPLTELMVPRFVSVCEPMATSDWYVLLLDSSSMPPRLLTSPPRFSTASLLNRPLPLTQIV